MNLKEAIDLADKATATSRIDYEVAKEFWPDPNPILTPDKISLKTYDSLKLIKSLISKDKAKKFIGDPTQLKLQCFVGTGKVKDSKKTSVSIWFRLLDLDGNVVLSATYHDWQTGMSIVDFPDGSKIVESGWKKIREHFNTVTAPKTVKKSEDKSTDNATTSKENSAEKAV